MMKGESGRRRAKMTAKICWKWNCCWKYESVGETRSVQKNFNPPQVITLKLVKTAELATSVHVM